MCDLHVVLGRGQDVSHLKHDAEEGACQTGEIGSSHTEEAEDTQHYIDQHHHYEPERVREREEPEGLIGGE